MSGTTYAYFYNFQVAEGGPLDLRCPDCKADLTGNGSVELHVNINFQPGSHITRLDSTGALADVADLVRQGYGCGCRCAECGEDLAAGERIEEEVSA